MNRDRYLFLMNWANEKEIRKQVICTMTKYIPFKSKEFYL